ncbi:DedA family protein [Sphingobium sp. 10 DY56-G10]|uniref:DedA family protein n=1 Tax=Sphingobium sp. 10 DY56-G10 TaxID=2974918 RepID=UPI00352BBE7A
MAVVRLFIPATAVMLAIGGLVGSGVLDPVPVVLWAVGGAVAGDWVSYGIGRGIGPSVYHRWPLRRHRPLVAGTRLFFRRHGLMAVLLGRFLGPIRATVPLVVRVIAMPRRPFHVANIASAVIWVPVMFLPAIAATYIVRAGVIDLGAGLSEWHLLAFGAGIVVITMIAMTIASHGMRRIRRARNAAEPRRTSR